MLILKIIIYKLQNTNKSTLLTYKLAEKISHWKKKKVMVFQTTSPDYNSARTNLNIKKKTALKS